MLGRVTEEVVGANAAAQLASNLLRYQPSHAAEMEYWCRLEKFTEQTALIYATLLREPVPGTPEEMELFLNRHHRALEDPAVQALLELMRTPRDPPQPWKPTHTVDECEARVRNFSHRAEEGKMRNAMVWLLHPDPRAAVPLVSVGPIAALETCPLDVITDWVNYTVGPLGRGTVVAAYWLARATRAHNQTVPTVANEVEFDDVTQYAAAMVQLLRPQEEGMVLCNAARVSYRWPFAVEAQLPAPAALTELDKATAYSTGRAAMEKRAQELAARMSALLLEMNNLESELLNTRAKSTARNYTPETHKAELARLEEKHDALVESISELEQSIANQQPLTEAAVARAEKPGSSLTAQRKAKTATNKLARLQAQLEARTTELERVDTRGQRAMEARAAVVNYDQSLSQVASDTAAAYESKKAEHLALKKEFDELDVALGDADAYADYTLRTTVNIDGEDDEDEKRARDDMDLETAAAAADALDTKAPQIFAEAWRKAHRNWQVEQRAKGRFDPARLRSFLSARGTLHDNRFLQVSTVNDWHLNARVVFRCCVCERASWMFWAVPMADMLWYCGGTRCDLLGETSASHALLLNTLFEARVQYTATLPDSAPLPDPTNLIPVSRRGQSFAVLPPLDAGHRTALQTMAKLLELYTSDLRVDRTFVLQSALFGGSLEQPVDVTRPSALFAGWSLTLSGAIIPPDNSAQLAPPLTPEMMNFMRSMQTVEEVHVLHREGTLAEAMTDVPVCINNILALPDAEMDAQRERKERAEADARVVALGATLAAEAEPMDIERKEEAEKKNKEPPESSPNPSAKRTKKAPVIPVGCMALPHEETVVLPESYWDTRMVMQMAAMNKFRLHVQETEAKGDHRYRAMVLPQENQTWDSILVNAVSRLLCSALHEEDGPLDALMSQLDTTKDGWNALLVDIHAARMGLLREAWDQWHDHVEKMEAQWRDAKAALEQAMEAHPGRSKKDRDRILALERRLAEATAARDTLEDKGLDQPAGPVSAAMSLRLSSDARLTWYEYARERRMIPMDPSHEDYDLALAVHAYQRVAASRVVLDRLSQVLPPPAGFSPRQVLASWLLASDITEPIDTEAKFHAMLGTWMNTHRAAAAFGAHATLGGLAAAEAERRADASGADPRLWVFALAKVPCFSVEHGQRLVQCARDVLEDTANVRDLPPTLAVEADDDTLKWIDEEQLTWRADRVRVPGLRLWGQSRPFLPFALAESLEPGQPPTVVDLSLLRHTGVRDVKSALFLIRLGNRAFNTLPQYAPLVTRLEQQTPLIEPHHSLSLFRLRGVMPLRRDVASMIVGAGLTVLVAQARGHTLPFQPLGSVPVVSRVPAFAHTIPDARIDGIQVCIQAAYRSRVPDADRDITVRQKTEWNETLRHMLTRAEYHTHDPLALFAPFGITDEAEALGVLDAGLYWLRQTSAWWSDPRWNLSERTQLALVSRLARVSNDQVAQNDAISALMLHQDAVYTNQPQPVRAALLSDAYTRTMRWIQTEPEYKNDENARLLALSAERHLTELLEARRLMIAETLATNMHAVVEHFSLVSRRDADLDITALARAYAPAKLEPNFVNYLYALQYMFVSSQAAAQWAIQQKTVLKKVDDDVHEFLRHRWSPAQLRALNELTPETATDLITKFEGDPLLSRLMRYRRVDALPDMVKEATNDYVRELYRVTQTALNQLQTLAAREQVPTYLSHWYLAARNVRDAQAITNAVRWCMEDPTFNLVPLRLVRIVVRHYLSIEETRRMGKLLVEADDLDNDTPDSSDDGNVEQDVTEELEAAKAQLRPKRFRPTQTAESMEEEAALHFVEDTANLAQLEREREYRLNTRRKQLKQAKPARALRPKRQTTARVKRFVQDQPVDNAWIGKRMEDYTRAAPRTPKANMTEEERARWEKRKKLERVRAANRAAEELGEEPAMVAQEFDEASEREYEDAMAEERERKEGLEEGLYVTDSDAEDDGTRKHSRRARYKPWWKIIRDKNDIARLQRLRDRARELGLPLPKRLPTEDTSGYRSPKGEETPSDSDEMPPKDEDEEETKHRRHLFRGVERRSKLPKWARYDEILRAKRQAPKFLGMRALAAMSEEDYATGGAPTRATAYRMRRQTVDPLTLFELGRGINADVPLEWIAWPPPELTPGSGTSPAMLRQISERMETLLPIYRKRAYDSLWGYGGLGLDAAGVPSVDLRPWTTAPRSMAPHALAWGALRMLVLEAEGVLQTSSKLIEPEIDDGADPKKQEQKAETVPPEESKAAPIIPPADDTEDPVDEPDASKDPVAPVDSSDDELIPESLTDEDAKDAILVRNVDRAGKRRLRAFQRIIDLDEALAADRMPLFLAEDDETVPQLALLNLPPVPLTPDGLRPLLMKMIPRVNADHQARLVRLVDAVLARDKGKFMAALRRASRTWLSWTRDEFGLRKSDLVQPFPPPDKGYVVVETPEIRDEVRSMQNTLRNDTIRTARINDIVEQADRERRIATHRWIRAVAQTKAGGLSSQAVLDPQDRVATVVDFLSNVLKPAVFLLRDSPQAARSAAQTWLTSAYTKVSNDIATHETAATSDDLGPFSARGRPAGDLETLNALSRTLSTVRRQSAHRGFDVVMLAREVARREEEAYEREDKGYSEQYCALLRTKYQGNATAVLTALARNVRHVPEVDILHQTQRLLVWSHLDELEANIRAQVSHVPREETDTASKKLHFISQDSATTTARYLHRFALSKLHSVTSVENAMTVYSEAVKRSLIGTVGLKPGDIKRLDDVRYNFATPDYIHQRMVLRGAFLDTMIKQMWPVMFPNASKHKPSSFRYNLFRGLYMEKCMTLMQHMYDVWKDSDEVTAITAELEPFVTHQRIAVAFESYKQAVADAQTQIAAGIVSDETLQLVVETAARTHVARVVSRLSAHKKQLAEAKAKPPAAKPPAAKPPGPKPPGKPAQSAPKPAKPASVSGPFHVAPPPPLHREEFTTPMPLPWVNTHVAHDTTLHALVQGISQLRMYRTPRQ